jgi:uridine kinase
MCPSRYPSLVWPNDGTSSDVGAPGNQRYVEGQRLYLDRCAPAERATIVIDYTDLDQPRVIRRRTL